MPNRLAATRFKDRLDGIVRDYTELRSSVRGSQRQVSLETFLAEQAAMSIGVHWESFITDLITAYVHKKPKACFVDFEKRIGQNLDDKFSGVVEWITFDFPASISLKQAANVLDPGGWNISITSSQKLRDFANRVLYARYARKFALSAEDAAFVDYLICLRNYLAHRSADSRLRLVKVIKQLDPATGNAQLRPVRLRDIGSYLKRPVVTAQTRVNVIAMRARAIADILA